MHNDIIEVTKVLDVGGGFGLTAAGDKVYIPRSVTAASHAPGRGRPPRPGA